MENIKSDKTSMIANIPIEDRIYFAGNNIRVFCCDKLNAPIKKCDWAIIYNKVKHIINEKK